MNSNLPVSSLIENAVNHPLIQGQLGLRFFQQASISILLATLEISSADPNPDLCKSTRISHLFLLKLQ